MTVIEYEQLAVLVQKGRVSLNNESLYFGENSEHLASFLEEKLGSHGYIVGIHARLNKNTVNILERLRGNLDATAVIEAQVDLNNALRFTINSVRSVVDAISYGLDKDTVHELAELALEQSTEEKGIELICAPFIDTKGKVRVTSKTEYLEFDSDAITFIKL